MEHPPPSDLPTYIKVPKLAELLGMPYRTIALYVHTGKIPGHRFSERGAWYVHRDVALKLLKGAA